MKEKIMARNPLLAGEPDRQAFMHDLAARNKDTWIEVQTEIQDDYHEFCIWFLVASKEKAIETYEMLREVIQPYLRFTATEFTASFRQLLGDQIIWWDALDKDEIRTGHLSVELCKYPDVEKISDDHTTVFGTVKKYLAERRAGRA